jgi:hypothetical protein
MGLPKYKNRGAENLLGGLLELSKLLGHNGLLLLAKNRDRKKNVNHHVKV